MGRITLPDCSKNDIASSSGNVIECYDVSLHVFRLLGHMCISRCACNAKLDSTTHLAKRNILNDNLSYNSLQFILAVFSQTHKLIIKSRRVHAKI